MVRTATAKERESSEERESSRKKSSGKKKNPATGVWPCKINGCNKQFAREADLKRHQRTTKQHSVPGFACPQCDAAFTRTDALRRHQKSRHNGVIVDPIEIDKRDGEDSMQADDRDGTGAGTPKDKGKDGEAPDGTSGHYRQHTATNGPPVNHPTSSTRNWPPPPPWATDAPAPAPMANFPLGGYFPQPFYRPASNSGTPAPPGQGTPDASGTPQPSGVPSLRKVPDDTSDADAEGEPAGPVIDPSLDSAEKPKVDVPVFPPSASSASEVSAEAAMAAISYQLQQALESAKQSQMMAESQGGENGEQGGPNGNGGSGVMDGFDPAQQAAIESLLAESGEGLLNSELLARAFPPPQ